MVYVLKNSSQLAEAVMAQKCIFAWVRMEWNEL